jgi:hypothetical protein
MKTLKEREIPRRDRSLLRTPEFGPSMTEQAHKDQCDMNYILKDYVRTGFIKHAKGHAGKYDDYSGADFQSAMDTVANVKSLFEGLPSAIKKEFNYKPDLFLDYMQNPENAGSLAKRGISIGVDGINIRGDYINQSKSTSSTKSKEVSSAASGEQVSDSAPES